MATKKFIVEVEPAIEAKDGKPSMGPVYRSVFAKDGFPAPIDGLDSCWDVFRLSVEKYPNNTMLGTREFVDGKHGKYVWLTYKQVYDKVIRLGNSIRACGVEPGGRCGIYGANCAEWVMSMECSNTHNLMQACNAHGLYCVPLYDTLGANAIEFIICHAEVTLAFVEQKKLPEVLKTFPNAGEYLKTIVSFGKVTPELKEQAESLGLAIYSWDEFLSLGDDKHVDLPVKKKSDICTIMYTSGTTGDPKGVLISNNSIVTLIGGVHRLLGSANESVSSHPFIQWKMLFSYLSMIIFQLNTHDVYLSFLPLAHIFDRVIEECFINHGASIGFWRGDVKLLIEDIGELKPTIFCAVPRVLDRIYSGLQQKISSGGFLKRNLFNLAYSYKLHNMKGGKKHSEASPLSDKIVFSKVKQGLGGNVRIILSGAAPLAAHVEGYLKVVACSHVLQGYGLTETCAGSFVSLPNEMSMVGTVGPPVPNLDARLESVPEMNYDALSSKPQGEICIRGDVLFSGYYKRDIGEWQPDGSMKIIDRKKNIFKLSQGEYVAVENLENVYGLVSDLDALKGFEFVRAVHLDPVPFDMERDLLTPTFKKKRPQMLKYYQTVIDNMYKNINKK
ncbi:AMP-binding, conserved site-containing protein [Cynara cardunculus var. scolymus]|uniref:AMP-binding, conserved site-containing protein n=1 Tax=Cynara cardunculus var. scolymus TaxID=59895 RepID=A0A103XJB3_CYNCS|nr:AMP-binding, conserved site-containing protein [Cynara cardunculus var. scolymus]